MGDVLDLRSLAAQQSGCFTTAQALSRGWTRWGVASAHRSGHWRQLTNGAYVEQSLWDAMDPPTQHLCAVHAALLTRRQAWHAGRRSAALAHELPLLGTLPVVPQLARQPLRSTDRSSSRHERLTALPDHDLAVRRNLPVTSLARTVIDLSRDESFVSGVVVADAALRQGVGLEQLVGVAERCRTWPGGPRALAVARFADGLAESPLESVSRVSMHERGLPPPELQVEVWHRGRLVARVDELWRDANLVGEPDGRSKYDSTESFYAEKRRQEHLVSVGLEVVRWDWRTAHNPPELERLIRRGMHRGRLNILDPDVRFVATTVGDALRRQPRSSRAA